MDWKRLVIPLGVLALIVPLVWLIDWARERFFGFDSVPYNPLDVRSPIEKYGSYADTLHESMKFWGTDEDKIFEILDYLNPNELRVVYNKFGKRPSAVFFGDKSDLVTWVQSELSQDDWLKAKVYFEKSGLV